MSRDQLILMCKAPRPGSVKTRMAATLGPGRACEIYRSMVDTLLDQLEGVDSVELRFTPADASSEVASWKRRPSWRLQPQGEGDLGQRMLEAQSSAFSKGARRVVIIGSDCPELVTADIHEAFQALQTSDLVLGPAVDGGYWLIGVTSVMPELFRDIPWSQSEVFEQTMARALALRLQVSFLRILRDIDTAEDWEQFGQQLK